MVRSTAYLVNFFSAPSDLSRREIFGASFWQRILKLQKNCEKMALGELGIVEPGGSLDAGKRGVAGAARFFAAQVTFIVRQIEERL
jgi:hypothetical protein